MKIRMPPTTSCNAGTTAPAAAPIARIAAPMMPYTRMIPKELMTP